MKKIFFPYVILLALTGTFFNGCESSTEKVEHARENVEDAQAKLEKARQDSIADYEQQRTEWAGRIAENEKTLADYKIRIAHEEKVQRERDEARLDELQKENEEMKDRMNGYGKDDKHITWADFKAGFRGMMEEYDREMTEFGNTIAKWTDGDKKK
jgi:hypothetical protein